MPAALPPDFATTRDAIHKAAMTLDVVNIDPLATGITGAGIAITADSDGGRALGDVYAWAFDVLGRLPAASGRADLDASPVRLWPEHFDVSIELGDEAAGRRAGYGVSPGDEQHPEPYVYVTPWTQAVEGPLWQATGFRGAELAWADVVRGTDALAWLLERLVALHA